MTTPPPSESEGRVVPFRPRNSLFTRRAPRPSPVESLDKYERGPDDAPDDYRHRMKMNALAMLVVLVLIGVGWWIANTMAQMRKDQDCVLTGRRACAPVDVPIQPR